MPLAAFEDMLEGLDAGLRTLQGVLQDLIAKQRREHLSVVASQDDDG